MVRFVDDTDRSTNDFLQPHLLMENHYIHQATMDAHHWNNILQLSGGTLQQKFFIAYLILETLP